MTKRKKQKEKKTLLHKLNLIKSYKGFSWRQFAKYLGFSSRFIRYFRRGERKSKKLTKKINHLYTRLFMKRAIFYVFKRSGSGYYGDILMVRDARSVKRYVGKMRRRGHFVYFSRRWDLVKLNIEFPKCVELWARYNIENWETALLTIEFFKVEWKQDHRRGFNL